MDLNSGIWWIGLAIWVGTSQGTMKSFHPGPVALCAVGEILFPVL